MRPLLLFAVISLAGCVSESSDEIGDDSDQGGKSDGADAFACTDPTWKTEVLAEGVDAKYTTLRIDNQGNTHVLYRDPAADRMRYTVKNANAAAWKSIPLPDTCKNVVGEPWVHTGLPLAANQNLAVKADGTVFVSCGTSIYSRAASSTTWRTDVLVTASPRPRISGSSIAIAPDGSVHAVLLVVRRDSSDFSDVSRHIELYQQASGGWSREEVAWWGSWDLQNAFHGDRAALCIGRNGPRIALQAPAGVYATNLMEYARGAAGGAWTVTDLRYQGLGVVQANGFHPACAIDSQGRTLHVEYNYGSDGSYNALEVIRKGAGTPVIRKIVDSGWFPDIAVRGDRAFIAYSVYQAGMYVQTEVGTASNVWKIGTDGIGSHTSLALDAAGRPHVAYTDEGDARLEIVSGRCQ
jgi:hypothetical protein